MVKMTERFNPFPYENQHIHTCCSSEEAELFRTQCHFDGDKYINGWEPSKCIPGGEIVYYKKIPKRKVKQMTVKEIIIKNNIGDGDFSLTFTNVLGIRIENPNPNIIADMTVKSVEIDWVFQTAKISVVTK